MSSIGQLVLLKIKRIIYVDNEVNIKDGMNVWPLVVDNATATYISANYRETVEENLYDFCQGQIVTRASSKLLVHLSFMCVSLFIKVYTVSFPLYIYILGYIYTPQL